MRLLRVFCRDALSANDILPKSLEPGPRAVRSARCPVREYPRDQKLVAHIFCVCVINYPWRNPLLRFLCVRELTGKSYFWPLTKRDRQSVAYCKARKVPAIEVT